MELLIRVRIVCKSQKIFLIFPKDQLRQPKLPKKISSFGVKKMSFVDEIR